MQVNNPQQQNIYAYKNFLLKESRNGSEVSSGNILNSAMTNPIANNNTLKTPNNENFIAYTQINFAGNNNINKDRKTRGRELAINIHDALKSTHGAIDKKCFRSEFNKISKNNVVSTIKAYNKLYPQKSLMADILTERGSSMEARTTAVLNLFDVLASEGKSQGVQVAHFRENFGKELTLQTDKKLMPKTSKLDRITNGLVQAIENKDSLTTIEKTAIANTNPETYYQYTTELLDANVKAAEKSFQNRVDYDGFFGKISDKVHELWNSPDCKKTLQSDINKHKKDIKSLKLASKKGDKEFKDTFKNIFNVDYDPELVVTYKNKEVELKTSLLAVSSENFFNEKLSYLLNNDKIKTPYKVLTNGDMPYIGETESKEEIYQRNYDDFATILGKGDKERGSQLLEEKFKENNLNKDSSIDEKYSVMVKLAKAQSKQLHEETQQVTKGKDINLIKKEFEASYNATFGVENDITKRVIDYNISQQVGEYMADCMIMGPIMIGISFATGSGVTMASAAKGAAVAAGANLIAYSGDRMMSNQGMSKEDIEDILKFSVLDGSTFIASALASTGINFFTSAAFKGASAAKKATEIALLTIAETSADATVQKVLYSEVKIDGLKFSATFSLAGQLLELKLL